MLLDIHLVHTLNNGWTAYRDDVDAFAALLPGFDAATIASWHAALTATPLTIRAAFAPGTPRGSPSCRSS